MQKLVMVGLGALLLAGCTTPEQKSVAMQAEVNRMMQVYGPACSKMGYAVNSDRWRDCILQLDAKEEAWRHGGPSYGAGFGRSRWSVGGYWGPYW